MDEPSRSWIVSHRSTDRPIQNTGHADLVEAPDGSCWMVLLGVRPHRITPGFHVLGRETFLASVEWVDDWPVVGEVLLDMPASPPGNGAVLPVAVRDDFDSASPPPQWISLRLPLGDAALLDPDPDGSRSEATAGTWMC